jgi:hypothetical protein
MDKEVRKVKEKMDQGIQTPFQMLPEGLVAMGIWIYLLRDEALKEEVLKEVHESHFASHPRSTKKGSDMRYEGPRVKGDANLLITRSSNPHAKTSISGKPSKSSLIGVSHKDNLYLSTTTIENRKPPPNKY